MCEVWRFFVICSNQLIVLIMSKDMPVNSDVLESVHYLCQGGRG